MAEFARSSRKLEQPSSPRLARAAASEGRRPPQKKRVANVQPVDPEKAKAAERRKIWKEDALLFFFFALLVDA